jgi:hypothetical protein
VAAILMLAARRARELCCDPGLGRIRREKKKAKNKPQIETNGSMQKIKIVFPAIYLDEMIS